MASNKVESVERALVLLNCFSEEHPTLSLKELAEATGFYKSTILRLAASLERFEYLKRMSDGTYCIGTAPLKLAEIYRKSFDVADMVRPILDELRDRFNESVALYIRSGEQRICLYRENANRAIRHQLEEGKHLPLEKGAAGRILLAYSGAAGEPYESILAKGWYTSLGERDPEVAAIGVPVFSNSKKLLAALCISVPILRYDDQRQQEFVSALQSKANELGSKLSHINLPW